MGQLSGAPSRTHSITTWTCSGGSTWGIGIGEPTVWVPSSFYTSRLPSGSPGMTTGAWSPLSSTPS
jgi:hypothetical protein